MLSKTQYDIIVIGGGPSGMMAAGRAAALGARVLLLEKNSSLGKKLLISGGGRSNITNATFDDRVLLARYKNKGKFLFSAFAQFSVKETLEFFHSHGMPTKEEDEGRVFPKSERAQSVWDTLVAYMKQGKVTVRMNAPVKNFSMKKEKITSITLADGSTLTAKAYIVAVGGASHPETGSTGDGFAWLSKLGHTGSTQAFALVPIYTKETWSHKLSGLAWKEARVSLIQNGVVNEARVGKILFTHTGLSGPLILNMSRDIGEALKQGYGAITLAIDLFPKMDAGALDQHIQTIFKSEQNKKLKNVLGNIVPSTLAAILPSILALDEEKEVNKISRTERLAIVKFLKSIPITPTRLMGKEKAVVSSGGVVLEEIDFKTMRSRIHENLYFVGDMLDIDRPSGGYSLQLCWTTGFVAGTHAGTHAKS